MAGDDAVYMLCRHCDYFVEVNWLPDVPPDQIHDPLNPPANDNDGVVRFAKYLHLEDGDQDFDHDAEPSDQTHTGDEWEELRPDLFHEYEDGKIGPNSAFHSRGKEGQ
jgi:hypothetical protein